MDPLDRLDWEILDSTADDCENLEQIYRQVCYELIETSDSKIKLAYAYRPVNRVTLLSEIADHIRGLVDQSLLTVVMDEEGHPWQDRADLSYIWRAWFRMSPQGKAAWESSEYFVEQEQQR
jgi:hypothetical protein